MQEIVVGHLPIQAPLARAPLHRDVPAVTVALRTSFALDTHHGARTHPRTRGRLNSSRDALADVLLRVRPAVGRLPAPIDGRVPAGHRLEPAWA